MSDFIQISPLKILEMSSQGRLGKGNLGVLIARAGVGKTACLIHIAFDKLFREERMVHVSLEDIPEKVTSYYNVIFYDLLKALNIEDEHEKRMLLEGNRMILTYLNQSFKIGRLRENIRNLIDKIQFVPDSMIVDGLDFAETGREIFEGFKEIAEEFQLEIWFSALSHRHITDINQRGIPYPCNHLDDLFSIIIQLKPTQSGVFLTLLKDHERTTTRENEEKAVRLDPNTFLALSK